MRRRWRRWGAWGFLLLFGCVLRVSAQTRVQIDIEKSGTGVEQLGLAIPQMLGEAADPTLGQQIRGVLKQDLEITGFFRVVDQATYPEALQSVEQINYTAWAALRVVGVVAGRLTTSADGQVSLQLALHDVGQQRSLAGNTYNGPKLRHREMAHRFSDLVFREFTGEPGPFDTQIICTSPGKSKNSKDIVIMDYDGYGARTLISDGSLNLSPVLSPNGTFLAYTSYRSGFPSLYMRNLLTGAEERLTSGQGLALAGSWSPDGRFLALNHTIDGNSEIFLYDTKSRRMNRLTNDWGIDVSPVFAPDGQRLAFVSDRAGSPQVYLTDIQGKAPVRLTYDGKYNTAPAWSPRDDTLAFVGRAAGDRTLGIYTIHADGSRFERLNEQGGSPEGPAWAPNGRFVMYTNTQGGSWRRYIMREDGQNFLLPASGPPCLVSQWVARTAR